MSDEQMEEPQAPNRRDFLRRSLVAGAVVWTAPVVTTLPAGRAWAQTYNQCTCTGEAYGLYVSIPGAGINETFGIDDCVDAVEVGNAIDGRVRATSVCAADFSTVGGGCSSEASISTLTVRAGSSANPSVRVSASVLLTTASATCSPCGTRGDYSASSISVSGSAFSGTVNVDEASACNLDVQNRGRVFVNEQICQGDILTVNAIHVIVPGVLEVIAAHSTSGASGCSCATC